MRYTNPQIHSLTHSSRLICQLVPWNTAIALDLVLYHSAAARVVNIAVGLLQARQRRPCHTAILFSNTQLGLLHVVTIRYEMLF